MANYDQFHNVFVYIEPDATPIVHYRVTWGHSIISEFLLFLLNLLVPLQQQVENCDLKIQASINLVIAAAF